MGLPQVVHQQFGGPDRGLITQLAWILSDAASIKGSMIPEIKGGRPERGRRGGVPGGRALRAGGIVPPSCRRSDG